jgi:hypothetical protein
MRSNKQRRQEIKSQRLRPMAKRVRAVNARPADRPVGTVEVTPARLRATTGYGIPDLVRRGYYQDRPFRCKDCGVDELWTAAQQRWWYEVGRGGACRRRARARETEARRVHLAGPAAKSRGREHEDHTSASG